MSRPEKTHFWQRSVVRLGGSAMALVLLFHFLPLGPVWTALKRLPLELWLLVLAAYLAAHFIGITKWRLMVNVGGAGLTLRQAARCYLSGLFSTLLLPSVVGGDVVRVGLALRFGKSKASVLLGSFLDRLLDFTALALLAAVGAVLVPRTLDPETRRAFVLLVAALAAILLLFAVTALWFPARKFSFGMRRRLVRLRMAGHSLRRKPQTVFAALGLGLVVQGSFIWLTSRVADASGLRLMFRAWLFAWPLAKFSAVIPVTQGGIGVREAALAGLLVPFGARAVLTVAVGLAWEAIIISGGLIAGLLALLLGKLPAPGPTAARAAKAPGQDSSPQ